MSIVIAILKKEWNLTSQQIASLGSIFLFGILIGNFLCAFLTDQIGRKTTFTLSIGLAVVLVYYISYC
jgi:MFS family permease